MTPTSKTSSLTVHTPFVIPVSGASVGGRDTSATATVVDLQRFRMRYTSQPAAEPLSVRLNLPQRRPNPRLGNTVRKLFEDRGFSAELIPDAALEWIRLSNMEIKPLPVGFYKIKVRGADDKLHQFAHITDRMLGICSGENEKKLLRGGFTERGCYEINLAYTPVTIIKHFGTRVYRLLENQTFATNLRTGELEDDGLVELRNGDIVILRDGTMFEFQSPYSTGPVLW